MSTGNMTTGFFTETLAGQGWEVRAPQHGRAILDGAADSRKVREGDLFVGFRGEHVDGNEYLEQALERGAAAIVGERAPEGPWADRAVAVVPDSRVAVTHLAKVWRNRCAPKVVGITGTVGKTSAKEMTAAVLRQHFRTHRSKENFNSLDGLPLAIVSLSEADEVSVLEMAMDGPGEIAQLCEIGRPDVGVVLNVGLTHVSKLGSIDAIEREKLSLVRWLPEDATAIVNADDPRVAKVIGKLKARTISFGESLEATLRRGPITDHGLAGCEFTASYQGEERQVRTPLPGAHVVPAALVAIAAAIALGVPFADAVDSVASAEVEGRTRILRTEQGVTVIDDRYNSSPASLEGALRMLAGIEGRRIAVLGTMAELGEHEAAEHARIGRIAGESCDVLAAVGEPCKGLVDAARNAGLVDASWYSSKGEAADAIAKRLQAGDVVLLKASRSQAFEDILPALGVTS